MSAFFIAIVSAVVGSLGTYIIGQLQRTRKIIEYNVSSISLLRLNVLTDSTISVSVSKSVLTGDANDLGVIVPLNNVYGFQVNIINAGNQDIDKLDEIEIRFDNATKIVKCETEPNFTKSYQIIAQKDLQEQNVCHISLPYINVNDQIVARIITTENEDSSCSVKAHGMGIKTRSTRQIYPFTRIVAISLIIFIIIATTLYAIDSIYIHRQPIFYFDPLAIPYYIMLILALTFVIIIQSNQSKAKKAKTFSKDWDWKVPEKKKNSK